MAVEKYVALGWTLRWLHLRRPAFDITVQAPNLSGGRRHWHCILSVTVPNDNLEAWAEMFYDETTASCVDGNSNKGEQKAQSIDCEIKWR